MSAQENIPQPEDLADDIEDNGPSIDDFFRELEAKERDLQITADLSIEIAELDLDLDTPAQSYVENDVAIERNGEAGAVTPTPSSKLQTEASMTRPAAGSVASKAADSKLQNELASLKLKVAELKAERSDLVEKKDQQLKDFENFKYRMDRERRGSFIDQIANLAVQMLPVLDNLNRAIDAVPAHAEEHDATFTHFFQGIVLVSQQVNEVFAGMGVEPIRAIGEAFDPHLHEAVAVVEDPQKKTGTVVEEMLRGYKIGNKVIRHSMVKVVTAQQASQPASEPPPPLEKNEERPEDTATDEERGADLIERF